jgi:hypothetical protein
MITTLFFIQLIAFQIWYITSAQVKHSAPSGYLISVLHNKQAYRLSGIGLLLLATTIFIIRFGWMSGICASIVGLMGVASLVILLNPFRYVNEKAVAMLYAFFLVLEFLI